MLITYFKDPRTLARYRSGLANLYLENFIVWLESQGYQRFTIRRHVREVAHFAGWAGAEGLALRDLDRGWNTVVGYRPQLARSGSGFVSALVLPRGNAADSRHLVARSRNRSPPDSRSKL